MVAQKSYATKLANKTQIRAKANSSFDMVIPPTLRNPIPYQSINQTKRKIVK